MYCYHKTNNIFIYYLLVNRTNSNDMKNKLPVFEIDKGQRLWLETVYDIIKVNKRPNNREIRVQLDERLPNNFHAASIDANLISSSGEEITLLGIMAIEKNNFIIEKADMVINAIRRIIKKNPKVEHVKADEIAVEAGLSEIEVQVLLRLISSYGRFYSGSTMDGSGFYGVSSIYISDDSAFHSYMNYQGMTTQILMKLEEQSQQRLRNELFLVADESTGKNKEFTLARQVLALHFLLKQVGINPIDVPTPVATFIRFLTGRELNAKRVQDTTIYKKVTKPYKLNDKDVIKDLKYIKQYFDDMELAVIVTEIEKEIKKSQQSG